MVREEKGQAANVEVEMKNVCCVWERREFGYGGGWFRFSVKQVGNNEQWSPAFQKSQHFWP